MQNFHLGKPLLVMLLIALISGVAVALRPGQGKADLTVWVFADSHYKSFQPLVKKFSADHHVRINLNILSARAETLRLGQLFMSDPTSDEIPDVAEIEVSLMARFFRPPVDRVGFLPLNKRLKDSGWYDKIVQQRFAQWSKEGTIFGVPHDVHPCTITYRYDLFWGAQLPDGTFNGPGPRIDLPAAKTWPQFQEACLKFQKYWSDRGFKYRHGLELAEGSADDYQKLLLQRGLNGLDSYGNVWLDKDPRFASTLAFYAQMCAGPRKISVQTPAGNTAAFARDLTEGNICALITPDWRLTYIKRYGAAQSGKMRMMPMPVFDPTDSPTSTWGGTMIGITKASRNKELAWELIEYLYFSEDGLHSRQQFTDILPPIKSLWTDPSFHKPDPYYGGQKVGELLTGLAAKIPPRYVTPATAIMGQFLNEAVAAAVARVAEQGTDGLDEWCKARLDGIANDLRARMAQWRFEE